MSTHPLEEILHPQSIAVVGASDNPGKRSIFVSPLLEFGFKGKIYPVNPKYSEISGLKAYPSLREIPGSVDYVISAVPASEVLNMLADCSQKGVKCVHLFTARFSETGRQEAAELEQEILKQARKSGIRLIGPNCMGIYYPQQGVSWSDDFPKEPGVAGLAFQSSYAAQDFVHLASPRGIRFSKVIGYGNALDFNESDFLDYLAQDPETKIILMYVEGVKDGKRFFNSLRQAASTKPVIIVKGGRGKAGTRAAASHTASLAGSIRVWETVVTQAGAISAQDLDELIDLAVSFYLLPPIKGRRVGVYSGAGGPSVFAADQCEEAGLDVIPLPTEIREELKSKGIAVWDWIGNPIDGSIMGDVTFSTGDMLQIMARNQNFDLFLTSVSVPRHSEQLETSVDAHLEPYKLINNTLKPLLAVVAERNQAINDYDNWKLTCEVKTKLIAANIPFYPTLGRAARAARKLIDYYQKRKQKVK